MILICPNNHPNREGARFCQTCGASLRQPSPVLDYPPIPAPSRSEPVMQVLRPVQVPIRNAPVESRASVSVNARGGQAQTGWATAVPPTVVLIGAVAVIVAFFLAWLAFSLPAASFILGPSSPMTISGYDLVTKGPGTYRSIPIVLVVLIPALGAFALLFIALRAMPVDGWRRLSGAGPILLGIGGLITLALLLTYARAEPEQLMSDLGLKGAMPSLFSAALVRIEPALGYALNLVGFTLLIVGGVADLLVQARQRPQRV